MIRAYLYVYFIYTLCEKNNQTLEWFSRTFETGLIRPRDWIWADHRQWYVNYCDESSQATVLCAEHIFLDLGTWNSLIIIITSIGNDSNFKRIQIIDFGNRYLPITKVSQWFRCNGFVGCYHLIKRILKRSWIAMRFGVLIPAIRSFGWWYQYSHLYRIIYRC